MIKIKLSVHSDWPVLRQTPGGKGVWGNCQFFVNQDIDECDWWVVSDNLPKTETCRCDRQKTIFVTGEPPTIKSYDNNFLKQFKTIITCERKDIKHPNIIYNQQGLFWMIGGAPVKGAGPTEKNINYDKLKSMSDVKKTKLISTIVSTKKITEGHKIRLAFMKEAKKHFKEKLDIFGVGHNPIPDKWNAIAPYKYHIAMENSFIKDYWTEKLSDTFLSLSLPVYYGCPNIASYFPNMPLVPIDIANINESIEKIEKAISDSFYEKKYNKIKEAKQLILDKYNFFASIASFCDKNNILTDKKEKIILKPEKLKNNIFKRIIRKII